MYIGLTHNCEGVFGGIIFIIMYKVEPIIFTYLEVRYYPSAPFNTRIFNYNLALIKARNGETTYFIDLVWYLGLVSKFSLFI